MKKILIISAGFLVLVGAIALYTYYSMSKGKVSVQEVVSEEDGKTVIEIIETNAEPLEEEFPVEMTEEAVQTAIHRMSHQKIEAEDDKKWGFIPLTAERVNRLIDVVEINEEGYHNAGIYLDILNRWKNNDFSQAHHDHNAIWNLQNGTIGRAIGVLSPEEEKAFIAEHFDIE